jgi:DNA-directed RNA polymerase subunit beta'|tara:strand:+ start:10700 stop:14485 length:3786 start_codon:yes stop_codon:yes gene_type:complete
MLNKSEKIIGFSNEVINKKKLQKLIYITFHNYGIIKSSLIADKVKNLTFHYATMSGISLSVEDLRVPFRKRNLIGLTTNEVSLTEQNYTSGNITAVERFQKVIDIWNNANNTLKDDVLTYFRESDPLNPLYIMAFSGARGNISQVRQLVGMRGLMADPQGQIIDLPIKSNFREGLKVTEYIISSYGARKGLVDTALRTADSGYLTRRLVDVAQDIIVREENCLTSEGLSLDDLFKKYKTELTIEDRLIGRLLIKPLPIPSENIILPVNTEVDKSVLNKIVKEKLNNIVVRSPLTCEALRSVCRNCYGWHLSYSKLIDLGEAVGILAAQSIGEPGTQLTMRTFHTGGVFSGDLTKQIRAPFTGTLKYDLSSKTSIVRTIHGEKGFNLTSDAKLYIENEANTICYFNLPPGAMLLANNDQKIFCNQVVAEIKKDANLILEEDKRDIYTDVSGEVFLQNVNIKTSIDGQGATKKISKTAGLIWVLYGNRYVLQRSSKLDVKVGQNFNPNETITSQKIVNNYSGIVNFDKLSTTGEINITNSSMVIKNASIIKTANNFDSLELLTGKTKKLFQLNVKPNELLKHGQTIACLEEDTYKTETGGTIYYSTTSNNSKKKKSTKKIFAGYLYWVPEETHQIGSSNLEKLKVKDGNFITKGTTLLPNTFSIIDGFVQLDKTNNELNIKPGELYQVSSQQMGKADRINRFVEPGEILFSNIVIQKLSFLEFINFQGLEYILLRPVLTYKVPQDKGFSIEYCFFPKTNNRSVAFRTVKRVFYRDGERIKSIKGVNLLQTFLVLDIRNKYGNLSSEIEYIPSSTEDKENQQCQLKLTLYEKIKINDFALKDPNLKEKILIKKIAQNNQYVTAKTTIAKVQMLTSVSGLLAAVNYTNNIEILILKEEFLKKCSIDPAQEEIYVKKGELVRVGTYLTSKTRSKYAGQIYKIENNQITIRLGRPYLISEGTVLRVETKSLVDKSDMLATLVYDKLKTVDIVQGLPKVEEILEARKIKNGCLLAPSEGQAYLKNKKIEIIKSSNDKLVIDVDPQIKVNFNNGSYVQFLEPLTDGPINPHDKLETLFNYYQLQYPVLEACKKSFKYLQLFLVNEVQRTYLSQGVQIADKHIEIIVKQMTSKVRISNGGDTTLLPGEILDITQAELITKAAISSGEEPPSYKPMLLGLTKASLNSDSFISAASFQETTRVLTEAAIEGKKDWLNGLKENVIIGRLIPAGTGFNSFTNLKRVGNEKTTNLLIKQSLDSQLKNYVLKSRLD